MNLDERIDQLIKMGKPKRIPRKQKKAFRKRFEQIVKEVIEELGIVNDK